MKALIIIGKVDFVIIVTNSFTCLSVLQHYPLPLHQNQLCNTHTSSVRGLAPHEEKLKVYYVLIPLQNKGNYWQLLKYAQTVILVFQAI